jgi:hypothetical protein
MARSRHISSRVGRCLVVFWVGCSTHHEPSPTPSASAGSGAPAGPTVAAGPTGPIADDYRLDIENLCDVMKRSGADQLEPNQRNPTIAMWLGPNIKTQAAHAFLVQIQPLQGVDKANALDAEAKRVGITTCALAAEWRTPNAVNPQ